MWCVCQLWPINFTIGKTKTTGLQGKLGYVFFTICVGLVCFYIGRVEFLADKLQAADRYTKMRVAADQNRPQVPVKPAIPNQPPPRLPQPPPVLNADGTIPNPFMKQDKSIVNQREQAIDLWHQAENIVRVSAKAGLILSRANHLNITSLLELVVYF